MKRLGPVLAVVGLSLAAICRWLDFPPPSLDAFGLPLQPAVILFWYAAGVAGAMLVLRACQEATGTRGVLTRLLGSPAGGALVALMLVFYLGVLFSAEGTFLKASTHSTALRQASVYGILACGMTLVIITGGIDLAVGSVLALGAVTFSIMSIHWGWPPWLAVPACLAVGAACGGTSGLLTARFRMQPFIATLAMMVFARGLAKLLSGQQKVTTAVPQSDGGIVDVPLPRIYQAIDSRVLGDFLSVVTIIFLVCVAVTWVLLARHRWGRQLYAIGGNEEAARLSGVPVAASKLVAYLAAGVLSAVAGICQAAQETHGDPDAGTAYELTAIAIVVIGGTNLMGGRGGVGLTLIGTLTIAYLEKILSINGVPLYGRLMLTGVIIVGAVLIQRRRRS